MKYWIMHTVVLALAAGTTVFAQQHRPLPASRIYGELHKLNSLTSVLYVAAHPDDENTRLLSWLATGKHIRSAYLSVTRGDGGQNILGSEQGAALGLIRTHELLEARELDGAGQFFTRAVDFGFSKHAEETFKHWDSVQLVRDIVNVIKQYRPDVMICRFPASRMAGHGHHEASAILARAAYEQCPAEFRPHRLLFNAFRFGNRSTVSDTMFKLEVGQYDPLIGMGYGELAGMSRSLHKSQGAGTPSTPGVQPEHFETLAGEPPTTSLFSGIDTTWNRVGRGDIGREILAVIEEFDFESPQNSVASLLRIRKMIKTIDDAFWRERKLEEIDNIILHCIGLTADASVGQPHVVAGDSVKAVLRVVTRAGADVALLETRWPDGSVSQSATLKSDELHTAEVRMVIPQDTPPTQPYWLAEGASDGMFALSDESLLGKPLSPSPLVVPLRVVVGGDTITAMLTMSHKKLDPVRGDVIEELRVVPRLSIEPLTPLVVAGRQQDMAVRLRAYGKVTDADFFVKVSISGMVLFKGITIEANTDTLIKFRLDVAGNQIIKVGVRTPDAVYDQAVNIIRYDHIPTLQMLEPARIVYVDEGIKVSAGKIAYIAGAGEYAPEFLRSLGVQVDEVTDEQILHTNELLSYDAVLVGIRAINTRKSMQYLMPSLMNYVEQGGTLVMQYNTTGDMATKDLGPFPLTLSRERVTEEDAAVQLLAPDHAIMTTPNVITQSDFDGWIQERGLYFPGEYDARYSELISMNDEGESPLKGSLLYAKHGKGHYVYCALSLFRQLPVGVPGAMKLMANLVSLGR